MENEAKPFIEKFIEKFDRPKIRVLNMVLLWFALLTMNYLSDMRFFTIQDFVNERCNTFEPLFFDTSFITDTPKINMTEIPLIEK